MSSRLRSSLGQSVWLAPAALYLLTVAYFARRTVADGYDGVGFVLALAKLDLGRFQPQPPGYPLLVVLGRLVAAGGLSPAVALGGVNALLLGTGIGAVAAAVKRQAGWAAGGLSALLLTLCPLGYGLGIATLSDGAGLGALLLALGVLGRGGRAASFWGGVILGMALGIRPTYAPLAALLLLLLAGYRGLAACGLAAAGALGAVLAWLGPFALYVGPRELWTVCWAHAVGHFTNFGGALTAERVPGVPVVPLLRGLMEAALGPGWPLGALLLVFALRVCPPRALAPPIRRLAGALVVGLAGYALWALVALPVREHARHLLPAVMALLVLLAIVTGSALQRAERRARVALLLGCGLVLSSLALTTARAIWAFRQPTPGVALAQYVNDHYPRGTLLYGARAARFLDLQWGSGSARPTTQFGDVTTEAERLDRLPAEVLCTSEVLGSPASMARLRLVARFCYDPRLPWVLRFDSYPDGCVELRAHRFRP